MRIIILLFFIGINVSIAQTNNIENTLIIHRTVLKELKERNSKFVVFPFTKKESFAGFNFKEGVGLDQSPEKPWNKKSWIDFLTDVDTALLKNYPLSSNGKPWFNSPRKGHSSSQTIVFAPIIFSNDSNKALCITALYPGKGKSGSSIAWYFEKEKENWTLKGVQTFLYQD